ncbi:MAG: hypothetical protein HWN67_09395 [Candidatus Helarchaeota archaeon]|nr:hypothetical protein [Candidatus Helarchaeota archaeon]
MSYKISFNKNKSKQIEQAVRVLASWIGEPDSNSIKTLTFLTLQNNLEEIQKLELEKANKLKKIDDFLISSNKNEIYKKENEIVIISVGDRGLANGIYFLYMKLKESQTQDPFSINWELFQTPHFETRGMTLNIPLGLEGLSTDTWTFPQWKDYLDRLRSFNYTSVTFVIYAAMLFIPDFEELRKNSWRYDVYEEVFKYAADIGLEIILLYVFNQIPPDLWVKFPEIRARVFGYQGISYCSLKRKELGEKILKYTLNRFKTVPSNALFAFEGGGCDCDYCRNNIDDLIIKYLEFIKENAEPERLYFVTWFANIKENFELQPIKGLRDKLFSKIPKDIKIVDVCRKTLQMAAAQSYEIFDFIFFIDPEAGMENQSIFPRPHINLLKERISDSIQAFGSNLKGIFGYRLTPKTRFINDYVLGRYLWNPEIGVNEVVSEVAGLLSFSVDEKEKIIEVILLLEDFWRTLDGNKLKECKNVLKMVIKQQKNISDPLKSIHEAVKILELLFRSYSLDSNKQKQRNLQKIFYLMREMETFHCYTSYKYWNSVSYEMIKQRVNWWTDSRTGLFNPKSFPENCVSKAKYHLINDKKDALPWM